MFLIQIRRFCLRWIILYGLFWILPCHAETTPEFQTFIAASDNNRTPNKTPEKYFDCSDMVYAVITSKSATNLPSTEHQLVVNWFNPNNKLEQETRYKFTSIGKDTFVWAWLRLSAPAGAAIGRIFDPAFGMAEFIGQWRVEILIDKHKVATHKFDVLC